ncbi:MAG: hypothetical protein CM1200mP10_00070 [Candidatus Neomarinimicrobiota bacterium]|nr:MAG: hypothetical protein CM1200mP10_00070 [Candidatus Neomarinimicrobiota bacterium]
MTLNETNTFLLFYPFFFRGFAFPGSQDAPHLSGADLSIFWVIPFIGILLSKAIFPLVAPIFGIKILVKYHYFGRYPYLNPY